MRKKTDLAIVNRSFWPHSQTIGEGLLQYAEAAARSHSVVVITQSNEDLVARMAQAGRGQGVGVRACRAFTTSASHLLKRIAEAVYFMLCVFVTLLRTRPATVYVATNPPVVVPFIVAVYCRLAGATYIYHLQDIHPEIANIVVPLNRWVFRLLQAIDNYTLRHAAALITLSEDMRDYLVTRSGTRRPIHLLDNPGVSAPAEGPRDRDVVFCGNAGRVNHIPLLRDAIQTYLDQGGAMRFTFAGGGLHAPAIKALADARDGVDYLGVISAREAAALVSRHRWALLPIEDEVTRYAFPSKSSGYVLSATPMLAVCGTQTSVARWVERHRVGLVCRPDLDALVDCFFRMEQLQVDFEFPQEIMSNLSLQRFAERLVELTLTPTEGALC